CFFFSTPRGYNSETVRIHLAYNPDTNGRYDNGMNPILRRYAMHPEHVIALVIPALEPDGRLPALLRALGPDWSGPAVVVDDGSSAAAQPYFAEAERLGATVLRHPANRGKGAALKTAFAHCLAVWPNLLGCVTADADGQHTPADIL